MKIPREVVFLSIIGLLIAGWIADMATAQRKYLGIATVAERSYNSSSASSGFDANGNSVVTFSPAEWIVIVEYEANVIPLKVSQAEWIIFTTGSRCRLYEIRGIMGRYGWCVTKEIEQ